MWKIFVTAARAISYAGSLMGIIEHYRVGDIVGGPTAGTNGDVYATALPEQQRRTRCATTDSMAMP